jgi:hypothetical protein
MNFDFRKFNALKKKREERENVERAGGGHAIAKSLMGRNTSMGKSGEPQNFEDNTDFNYGANENIDARIAHDQENRCMERVVCSSCGVSHGFCAEITEDKEKMKMLPTGNESQPRGGNRKGGMEWLKNEDLSLQPKEAKILMVRYNKEGRFGARVEMKLAIEGKIKYWGVPPKSDDRNPNYRLLTGKFGHDENNWVDQRILLMLEQDDFSQQYFVRVDFMEPTKASTSSTTRSRGSAHS